MAFEYISNRKRDESRPSQQYTRLTLVWVDGRGYKGALDQPQSRLLSAVGRQTIERERNGGGCCCRSIQCVCGALSRSASLLSHLNANRPSRDTPRSVGGKRRGRPGRRPRGYGPLSFMRSCRTHGYFFLLFRNGGGGKNKEMARKDTKNSKDIFWVGIGGGNILALFFFFIFFRL